jgi:hypothetical protein
MRKQMVIGVGMMVLQQFSGINAVVFYRCLAAPPTFIQLPRPSVLLAASSTFSMIIIK